MKSHFEVFLPIMTKFYFLFGVLVTLIVSPFPYAFGKDKGYLPYLEKTDLSVVEERDDIEASNSEIIVGNKDEENFVKVRLFADSFSFRKNNAPFWLEFYYPNREKTVRVMLNAFYKDKSKDRTPSYYITVVDDDGKEIKNNSQYWEVLTKWNVIEDARWTLSKEYGAYGKLKYQYDAHKTVLFEEDNVSVFEKSRMKGMMFYFANTKGRPYKFSGTVVCFRGLKLVFPKDLHIDSHHFAELFVKSCEVQDSAPEPKDLEWASEIFGENNIWNFSD